MCNTTMLFCLFLLRPVHWKLPPPPHLRHRYIEWKMYSFDCRKLIVSQEPIMRLLVIIQLDVNETGQITGYRALSHCQADNGHWSRLMTSINARSS